MGILLNSDENIYDKYYGFKPSDDFNKWNYILKEKHYGFYIIIQLL